MREPVALLGVVAGVCFASQGLAEGRIALERFEPAARPGVLPFLADAPSDHTVVSASALVDMARAPLGERVVEGTQESSGAEIVGAQTVLHLGLSLPLARALEGTARLPLSLALEGAQGGTLVAGPGAAGLGDTELGLRARVWGVPSGRWVGVNGALSLPTTTGGPWTGAGTVAGGGGLSLGAIAGRLTLRLDVAARVREETRVANLRGGSEARVNAGISFPLLSGLEAGAGLAMATGLGAETRFARSTTFVELDGAARYALLRGVKLLAGAGFGLTEGYGTPSARFFGGLDLSFGDTSRPPPPVERGVPEPAARVLLGARVSPRDTDRDGLADTADRCVETPEDRDGVLDQDGCPEADVGVASSRLRIVGEGDVGPETTDSERAVNRRAEVVVDRRNPAP